MEETGELLNGMQPIAGGDIGIVVLIQLLKWGGGEAVTIEGTMTTTTRPQSGSVGLKSRVERLFACWVL